MGAKATFDPITRIIKLTEAPTLIDGEYQVLLDVQADLYGDMKEDWLNIPSLRSFIPPIRGVGGDPLPGSKTLGDTYFLRSDWKIEPYDANQRLTVEGNLYSEDGTSPFIKPSGGTFFVQIERAVSNLVDSTIAQLSEIQFSSYEGAVNVDVLNNTGNAIAGFNYPAGTLEYPVDNFDDAMIIAQNIGLRKIRIHSSATIGNGHSFDSFKIVGTNKENVVLNIDQLASVNNCVFQDLSITGYLDLNSSIKECSISNFYYVEGDVHNCEISGTLTIGGSIEIYNSYSGAQGVADPAIIDLNNQNHNVAVHNWSGHIKIINMANGGIVGIGCIGGAYVEIDSTVSSGMIHLMGNFRVIDNSTGTAIVRTDYVTSPINILSKIESSAVLAKDATVAKDSTVAKDATVAKDSTVAKEATITLIKIKTDGLPSGIEKGQDLNNFQFAMISSADHISFTPLLSVSAQISIDGGAFAPTANAVVEVGLGLYKINLTSSEMNGDVISLLVSAIGADTRIITIVTT